MQSLIVAYLQLHPAPADTTHATTAWRNDNDLETERCYNLDDTAYLKLNIVCKAKVPSCSSIWFHDIPGTGQEYFKPAPIIAKLERLLYEPWF